MALCVHSGTIALGVSRYVYVLYSSAIRHASIGTSPTWLFEYPSNEVRMIPAGYEISKRTKSARDLTRTFFDGSGSSNWSDMYLLHIYPREDIELLHA